MAIESTTRPARIRDYWPRYKKRSVILTIIMQLTLTIAVGAAVTVTGVMPITPVFWVFLLAVFCTAVGVNVLLFNQLAQPLHDITNALTHVSGEPTIITPPNPNAAHFESDGFKPLLQLIYELAATRPTSEQTANSVQNAGTEDFIRAALDTTSAGFIILNRDGDISYANKTAPVSIAPTGRQTIDLIFEDAPDLATWIKECEESAVHAEKVWHRVPNKVTGEEGRRIFDVTASYQKGSAAEVVITLVDRSETYQPEDDELDFIAFAAHELRGPITVIRGYLDVLGGELDDRLEADQVELLQRLVVSANRLSGYINNILNASRYDRRHLRVHLREETLAGIYQTIADDMQLRASSQNRLLSINIPDTLPTVAADSASLGEVMSNLVDNALKYSHEGGIVTVTADADDLAVIGAVRDSHEGGIVTVTADADDRQVNFSVSDNGIGMPGNVVSNLFHKFYRSHRSRETVAGTGIGLYISKAIVESHGGTISVRSIENEGSVFTISLPHYNAVADKLAASHNSNEQLIEHQQGGWIKNHSMFRG